jgi:acyl-CoA thioester hydrolase
MQGNEELRFVDGGDAAEVASAEFRLEIEARAEDVDEQGHVSNLVYVRWVQDVARAHSAAVGYDLETYVRIGSTFVVRKHEISYFLPAFAGDRVALLTHVAWWRSAISERRTRIVRIGDGRELARAATLWAFVSVLSGRPRRIPAEIREAFARPPRVC